MKSPVEFNPSSAGAKSEPAANGNGTNGANGHGHTVLVPALPGPRARVAPVRANASDQWWQLASAAVRHWVWVLVTVALFVAVGIGVGRKLWPARYTATAQVVRYDTPDPQLFQTRPVNPATLVGMIGSPEVRTQVAARLNSNLTEGDIASRVRIAPVPNTDLVNITMSGADAATATAQANAYAEEAVKFTQAMQARDAREAASYLRHQITDLENEAVSINEKLAAAAPAAVVSTPGAAPGLTLFQTKLEEARMELADLQARYTDAHPLVQLQMARVAALEKQMAPKAPAAPAPAPAAGDNSAASASAAAPAQAGASMGDLEVLRDRARMVESRQRDLNGRLQITELLAQNPIGHYQLFSAASTDRAAKDDARLKIALFAAFLGLVGLVLGVVGSMTEEVFDRRLRTSADVRRVTQLPVLAKLGAVDKMSEQDKARWAFRTWTALQSRLSPSPNQGFVVGFTSSSEGEGRSTWIKLLGEAASQCGFRVATLTTRDAATDTSEDRRRSARPAATAAASSVRFRTKAGGEVKSAEPVLVQETELSDDLLADPDVAVEQMLATDNDGKSVVHIPLPGWVWNLEHRKEWLNSLNAWSAHENMVVLVELPPASEPEAVLLAQNLPNVIWLADSTKAEALESQRQIETLRLARCPLIGAVMNRSSDSSLSERFARWTPAPAMAALALASFLAFAPHAGAAEAAAGSFSIVSPAQRAAWQQQLTLGPGDTLRIALYGEPAGTQSEVTVQPDGRLSFLEAHDVVANGLTIDQLRQELDRALGEYRRSARTMISPVAFRSKKYHMLGLVSQKGAFTLDRPMTIVEAVARARGFETGPASGEVSELADLQHAFLVRNGQRQHVDFARLFNSGDLSQNIPVEPGDYFYFPPATSNEVYVLGAVQRPGAATLSEESTSLRAIAATGGFTNKAWRTKVLVVRGSLNEPKAMTVNLADVLAGKAADIVLEPHDIIYVSKRPWWKAEDLLDEAARAFTQSLVVYWTTDDVLPVVPNN